MGIPIVIWGMQVRNPLQNPIQSVKYQYPEGSYQNGHRAQGKAAELPQVKYFLFPAGGQEGVV